MLDHYLQRKIVHTLVEHNTARFAELKPKNIDSNHATYHLNSLIKQGIVAKNEDGSYQLTDKGKLLGISITLHTNELIEQAHAVIFVAVRDGERWLLRKRLVQPMFGYVGFMHGEPKAGETMLDAAARILQKRTGLHGECQVRGTGFVTLREAGSLLSYVQFVLVEAHAVHGELIAADAHGENAWYAEKDLQQALLVPSMPALITEVSKTDGLFFSELSFDVAADTRTSDLTSS